MHDIRWQAVDAKALLWARCSGTEGALDGFPIEVLLDECLRTDHGGAAAQGRARDLLVHLLAAWATTIEHDLDRFPPASIEVLQTIRQRMVDARDALQQLRALLDESADGASHRAGPGAWLGSLTRGTGGVLAGAPNPFDEETALQGPPRRDAADARRPAMAECL